MDPETALRVSQSEGFNRYVGDQGRSFGDWQLFTGGGVGNRALAAGINVRDPRTWKQQTDFALDVAKKEGWSQWHGARCVGIGDWQGINVKRRGQMPEPPPVPEPPAEGLGNGKRADMGEHIAALGRHIDRFAEAQMRVHATFEVNAGAGLTAKAKRLRSHSDGPVRGNVGVSMPQTEIG